MADLLEGYDAEGGEDFCEDVYNLLKNHWRQSDPIANLAGQTAGMIVSDSDDEKLYHIIDTSPGFDEILQENFSFDANPIFNNLFLGGGKLFVNELSDAFLTDGICINMGTNADEILALKQSNCAHGVTDKAETDTFSYLSVISSTEGGLLLVGFTENEQAFNFVGVCTNGDTTKSTAGKGPIILKGRKKSGTGWGAMGANENIVVIADHANARAIFDSDGDLDLDATANDNVWDDHNDLILAHDFSRILAKKWDEVIKYNAQSLHEAGLIHYTPKERSPDGKDQIFVRMKQGFIFTLCTFAQIFEKMKMYDKILEEAK